MSDSTSFSPTERTRVRRHPERASYERSAAYAILDEALACHVGFVAGDQPFVIPTIHARRGDRLFVHGAAASRMIASLAGGAPVCLTVTLLDGLVLARSAFHHSMNYRSVVVLGRAAPVRDLNEKRAALEAMTERLAPGRWQDIRQPSDKELRATSLLELPIAEASVKSRSGPPMDDDGDYALPHWAGVVPTRLTPGDPIPDPRLAQGTEPPAYLIDMLRAWD